MRVRVVQIDDSPFAPVFEVVEKPNTWGRALEKRVNEAEGKLTRLRQAFWNRYLDRHPGTFEPARSSNVWVPMFRDQSVILSMYVGSKTSGVFLRGPRGSDGRQLAEFMSLNGEKMDEAFGPSRSKTEGYYYSTETDIPLAEEERWDELIDWMDSQRRRYVEVFQVIDEVQPSK